jgi:hypothetical protein
MAIGAVQSIGYVGANITFGAAVAFDGIAGGLRRFLWVKNASGVSTQITIVVPGTTFEQNNPDVVVNVAAGSERVFGPLVPELNDPAGGVVLIGVTPTTSVTYAAVDLPTSPPDLP